jgi:hypothetical protein
MKFSDWMQIREVAAPPMAPSKPGVKTPPQPGEAARRNKTRTAIQTTMARNLGKPPKVQIAALQGVGQRLATDVNADDGAIGELDTKIKEIQAKAGIKV